MTLIYLNTDANQKGFRIIEEIDQSSDLDNLKGDTYCPKVNKSISPAKLREEEINFEALVQGDGVYGYTLEKWNPEVNKGWEHVDSCWGFVGEYDDIENDHYIVDEMKRTIEKAV